MKHKKYHSKWLVEEACCGQLREDCVQGTCENCGGGQEFFFRHPIPNHDAEDMFDVSFKLWMADPETNFLVCSQQTLSVDQATDRFEQELPKFIQHHAVKRHQAAIYRAHLHYVANESSCAGFFELHFDFAENFTCASQNQIQAAYLPSDRFLSSLWL